MSKPFRIIKEDEQKIIVNLYNKGEYVKNIAKLLNRDRKSIRKILNIYLGKDRESNYHKHITKEIEEKSLFLLKEYNGREVCEKLNISSTSLKNIKTKHNLKKVYNNKYIYNHDYFNNIDNPNKAYILGFLYADGCLLSNCNKVCLVLQLGDEEILIQIRNEIGTNRLLINNPPKRIGSTSYTSSGSCSLILTSYKIRKSLEKIGLTPKKSLTLVFPETLSEELYPHFIRGYFDGDGHVSNVNKRLICNTTMMGTLEFLSKVKIILDKEGIYGTIRKEKRCNNVYWWAVSSRIKAILFSNYIYKDADLYLKRKYNIFENWKKLPYDKRKNQRGTISINNFQKDNSL